MQSSSPGASSMRRTSTASRDMPNWLAVNDYEWQLLQQKTGLTVRDLTQRVEALIVTRGHKGSVIYTHDSQFDIPCAKVSAVVDPTGCGDAYRAGLLHGLMHDLDYETCGQIAAVMGALKIESRGTQNHRATPAEIERRLARAPAMRPRPRRRSPRPVDRLSSDSNPGTNTWRTIISSPPSRSRRAIPTRWPIRSRTPCWMPSSRRTSAVVWPARPWSRLVS